MATKIIADSGSTKTLWAATNNGKAEIIATTGGLNPYHTAEEDIERIVNDEVASRIVNEDIDGIFFYGSGITPAKRQIMGDILGRVFPSCPHIEAESDMLGAARAILGAQSGIACILGTGANSCYYDGTDIKANTPPLGYILGDEGGGASIGKHLVNALYKNPSLDDLRSDLEREYNLSLAYIIEKVYRQPMANRFLASLAPFARKNIGRKAVRDIVRQEFADFFSRNLSPYPTGLPVGFIGSIAFHFEPLLREVAETLGYNITTINQSPIEGLAKYHEDFPPQLHSV